MRSFDPNDPWTVSGDLAVIPGDPAGRFHDGRVYVVGRGGANLLQVYDPAAGFALVREFSLGAGRNPQDIAFDSAGEAYVSCYDEAVLLRVDVDQRVPILDTYDTSIFADADGLPETAWMIAGATGSTSPARSWTGTTGTHPPGRGLCWSSTWRPSPGSTWIRLAPGVQPIALIGRQSLHPDRGRWPTGPGARTCGWAASGSSG